MPDRKMTLIYAQALVAILSAIACILSVASGRLWGAAICGFFCGYNIVSAWIAYNKD